MKYKILIIDDDKELCELLRKCLEHENLNSDISHNGLDGILNIIKYKYHLVVLDIMMPTIDGFETLKKIRDLSSIPVLMLTSRKDTTDKIKGLEYGADDYLTKPFDIEEFIARVNSLIRRYTKLNNSLYDNKSKLYFDGLTIDFDSKSIIVEGQEVELNPKEFAILYYLSKNQGKVLTKKQIYEEVWEDEYAYDNNNIMSVISRLRKKIELNIESPQYIETIRGMGYRFNRGVWND